MHSHVCVGPIEVTLALALIATLALTGLAFAGFAFARLRRGRVLAAGGHGLVCMSLLGGGAISAAVLLNLHTYNRLTIEHQVAELEFNELGPRRYHVRLALPDVPEPRYFELNGDEWQLDARIIKWQGFANVLGFDTQFRLERLSGRYRDIGAELDQTRSVYALAPQNGLDLWAIARQHGGWLPWVDAIYGSASYLPMRDQARYQINVTQSGLVARALNPPARTAIELWDQ